MLRYFFLMVWILFPCAIFCQDSVAKKNSFEQQDLKDWLIQKHWIKKKPEKNTFILIIPVIASSPTTGVIFGAGLTTAFKASNKDERFSSLNANATYSSKGFLNLNVKSNIFLFDERMVLNNDWRYQINSETTYGLGTNKYATGRVGLNGYQVARDSLGQSLQYNLLRLHTIASWKLFKNFFAGIGFQYDYYYDIKDETVDAGDSIKSFHYQYSRNYGFDPKKYTTSGVSLNLLFDSRDNQVSAYKGYYANINYLINSTALGSTKSGSMLLVEYRSFHKLGHSANPHILGFWFYGNFLTSGDAPYIALPALGYDQRQRSGRGYFYGQFRGEKLLYAESEYRFPISAHSGILGGVLFANLTTASDHNNITNSNIQLLDYIRTGYGGGLRIMLDKKTRTRLQIDVGIANKAAGIYFGAQETF
jgi:hypothetical protein